MSAMDRLTSWVYGLLPSRHPATQPSETDQKITLLISAGIQRDVTGLIVQYTAELSIDQRIARDLLQQFFFQTHIGASPDSYFRLPRMDDFQRDSAHSLVVLRERGADLPQDMIDATRTCHGVMLPAPDSVRLSILIHRTDASGARVICRFVIVLGQFFPNGNITYRLRATQEVRPADGTRARIEICPADPKLYTAEELGEKLTAAGQVGPYTA